MADETGNAKGAVVTADKSQVLNTENLGDAPDETKQKFLKRIKKEGEANKVNFETIEKWIEVTGKKVLIKEKNRAGSLYTFYWFNHTKHKAEFDNIKAKGGATLDDKFVPLKAIDNKPYTKKATK